MKRNIYNNTRHGIYSGTDKVDPVKPVSPPSPIPNKYPPHRNEQQPVKRNADEKPAKSFKDMLEEEMEKNKNNASQSWVTDLRGNRITDESARDKIRRNKSEMEDINRRMSGRSKADNFRDFVRLRDLQNENDYFDELGIKSGYDRNKMTLKALFSSVEDTQDNPQEQMIEMVESTLSPYTSNIDVRKNSWKSGNYYEYTYDVTVNLNGGWKIKIDINGNYGRYGDVIEVFYKGIKVAQKDFDFSIDKWSINENKYLNSLKSKLETAISQMKNHEYDKYVNKHIYPNGLPNGVEYPVIKAFNEVEDTPKSDKQSGLDFYFGHWGID